MSSRMMMMFSVLLLFTVNCFNSKTESKGISSRAALHSPKNISVSSGNSDNHTTAVFSDVIKNETAVVLNSVNQTSENYDNITKILSDLSDTKYIKIPSNQTVTIKFNNLIEEWDVTTLKAVILNYASTGSRYTVDELLTRTFPTKISNDTGLNPCKADIFVDDIAVSLPEHYQYFKNKRKFYRIENFLEDTENLKKEDIVLYEGLKRIEKQKWAKLYGPQPQIIANQNLKKKIISEKDLVDDERSSEELVEVTSFENKISDFNKPITNLLGSKVKSEKLKKKSLVKDKTTFPKISKYREEKPSFFKDFKPQNIKNDPKVINNGETVKKAKFVHDSKLKETTLEQQLNNLFNVENHIINELNNKVPATRSKRAAATTLKERLWDDGVIPYEIDETFSSYRKTLAKKAMQHWENYTCLKFIPRNKDNHPDYVFFTERPCGCCSFVGKRKIGAQALSIGEDCAKFGIIVHEIGHAIGYYHEHTRPDRDNYVHILKDNIIGGQEFNFNIMSSAQVTSLGLRYDYGSIMHYARNTYSKNVYLDTIEPIGIGDGQKEPDMGQRIKLSDGDIEQTNILYQCPKCGKTFQSKSGTLSSPNYNLNTVESQISCEWRISATPGEKIVLNISSMDIFKSSADPDCSTDYIEVRDGYWHKSPLLGRYCGKSDHLEIKSNGNRLLVLYAAKNVKEHKGFNAEFKVVCGGVLQIEKEGYLESPNYPEHYTPNKECIWKVMVPEKFQVALKFLSFDLEHQVNCNYDNVEIRDGLHHNSTLLKKFCGKILPLDVVSSSNEMYIKFESDDDHELGGFSAKVVAEYDECSETEHRCQQNCVNTLGSFRCTCNPGYELHSDKKSCVDACGGFFDAPNGTVTSPSFPEFYPPNKSCNWEIKAPPQHKIFLNFTHFDIEGNNYEHQNCEYDQVTVSSILSSGKIKTQGEFCGKKKPQVIISESNHLKIEFYADDNVQQTGFAAVYFTDPDECANKNGGCEHDCTNTLGSYFCSCRTGFTLHENGKNCIEGDCVHEIFTPPFGTINSPNYPKHYPPNKDCAWHISTVPGHRIRLGFLYFRLEQDQGLGCSFDSVQVYDGDSSKAAILDTFCGSALPYLIHSSENQLYLTFKSDKSVQKKGFWATHSTVCGGVLQASSEKRKIYSHTHFESGENYENMANCDWYIIGGSGYNVHITFTTFDLEEEEDCDYDYVEIFDGIDSRRTSLGKYCGSKLPPDITSTFEGIREGLTISFRTDDRFTGKGFSLEYEAIENMYSSEEYA